MIIPMNRGKVCNTQIKALMKKTKLLRENIRESFMTSFCNDFLIMTPKIQAMRKKQINWTSSQLKLPSTKEHKVKMLPKEGGKYIQIK